MATMVIFLTTTGTGNSWTVPADWNNASNTIEAIGAGGTGDCNNDWGGAGGGGAYAIANNVTLTPGGSVSYNIGAGTGTVVDTMFNTTTTLLAKAGANATGGDVVALGGSASSCYPTTGAFSGGNGGIEIGSSYGNGGGGGAAGPNGAGQNGGNALSGAQSGGGGGGANGGSSSAGTDGSGNIGGNGGNGNAGAGGGAGGASGAAGSAATANSGGGGGGSGYNSRGGAGATSIVWTSTLGATAGPSGGGGGAGRVGGSLSAPANYGAGGASNANTTPNNPGGRGIIVITYTPASTVAGAPSWRLDLT